MSLKFESEKIESGRTWVGWVGRTALLAALFACQPYTDEDAIAGATASTPVAQAAPHRHVCPPTRPAGEVRLPGGTFTLGAHPERAEEGPPRKVTVAPFSIDRTEVTNEQFARFVDATGYVTLAERKPDPRLYPGVPPEHLKPSGLVFVGADSSATTEADWWRVIDGANWRHPEGPGSDIKGREHHPVVQIAYDDALAYARWRGRDLPTEAEWEYAARGKLEGSRFEWGDQPPNEGESRANTWQGRFPAADAGQDGYKARTAPVGCYPANGFGLYDMSGNVWEWTKDWFPDGRKVGDPERPHLIKGGSFLCSDNFCARYRPSARQGGPTDTGSSHIGFRTVTRAY